MQRSNLIMTLAASVLAVATANLAGQNEPNRSATEPAVPDKPDKETREPAKPAMTSSYFRASQIIGKSVHSDAGEELGKVKDLIVSPESGAAPFAIIEHGGALGIGATKVLMPFNSLSRVAYGDKLTISTTKAELLAASPTPTGTWMQFANEEWAKGIDRYFGQPAETQPLSGSTQDKEFVREPAGKTTDKLTNPSEQQQQQPAPARETDKTSLDNLVTKPGDRGLQQQLNNLLRQDIGPAGAGQVQATTENGVVTLKGEVASETQRQNLEARVKALSGVTRVDNQITVKKY